VPVTDLALPPDDPEQKLRWARQLLRDFPPGSQILGAKEIRAMAREIIKALSPPDPAKLHPRAGAGARQKGRHALRQEDKPISE
jgi:hypothetical protein